VSQTDRPDPVEFVRSPYSGTSGQCVEVGLSRDGTAVHVRDSKHPDAHQLAFSLAEWAAFLAAARDGHFNVDALPR
jgi:hypothetical protein